MAKERQAAEMQKQQQETVAKLNGQQPKVSDSATPVQGSLFDAPEEKKQPVSNLAAAIAVTQGEGRLHLDQLAWLMSDGLKLRIKEVAGLRAVAAKEAEQAKSLAENGVPQAVIEPHTRAAVEAKDKYLAIYAAVDKELGELYISIETSLAVFGEYASMATKKGINMEQLKAILRPYWVKIGSPSAASIILSATPEPEPSEEEKAQRAARLHAIRTYFMRKDTKLTQKRIDKMVELIAEVQDYGLPTEEYEAVLAQEKKDFEEIKKDY